MIKPSNEKFFFIGIDQTGAVDSKGNPKKLSAALIVCQGRSQKYHINLHLASLKIENIKQLIEGLGYPFKLKNVSICVDSALGLPETYGFKIRDLIQQAQNYTFENKPYGAMTAHSFFNSFRGEKPIYFRKVEALVGANSVFKLKPFQKNIGCGTYRILKDLSYDSGWYTLWPFEQKKSQKALICEGYPSYYWKNHFKLANRNLNEINQLWSGLKFINQDFADSFVLAWIMMKKKNELGKKMNSNEGWILGVPHEH
ncbi:MAG: hypothetical protein ACK5V3_04790 [Bdellovibrionales bacterium]